MPIIYINNDDIRLNSSSSDKVVVNGNLGIGTTSPAQKLEVSGNQRITGGFLEFFGGTTYPQISRSAVSGGLIINTSGAVSLSVPLLSVRNNSGSDFITVLGNGNVGIGTASPSALLTVSNTVDNGAAVRVQRTNALSSSYTELGTVGGSGRVESFNGNLTIGADAGNTDASSIIQFKVDNSEKVRITSTGNVGIGTTSPAQKLDVSGNIQATTGLILTGNAAKVSTTYSGVTVTNFFTDASGGVISVDGSNRISLRQGGVSGTDAITIAGSGNVGIGTTSPGSKLEISSTSDALLELNGGTTANPYMLFAQNGTRRAFVQYVNGGLLSLASEYGDIRFMTGTGGTETEKMRITAAGNVGIGITAPAYKLDVDTSFGVTFGVGQALRINREGLGSIGITGTKIYSGETLGFQSNDASTSFNFAYGNTSLMTIKSDGKVGIGTTAPAVTLEANGKVRSTRSGVASQYLEIDGGTAGAVYLTAAGASKPLVIQNNNTTQSDIWFDQAVASSYLWLQAGTERMRITSAGNVGIGTNSPSALFVVSNLGAAGIELQPEQTTDTNRILNYDRAVGAYMDLRIDANAHQFMISGTERMRITSAGNVGIGTTSPNHLLDVDGLVMSQNGLATNKFHKTTARYHYSNGYLIATNIATSDNNMIQLEVTGNTYSGITPLKAQYQCYNYVAGGTIIRTGGISTHPDLTVDVFHYNGYVYFWLEQTSANSTLTFDLYSGLVDNRQITAVTDAAKPTTGVTNSVTITPRSWWTSDNDGTGSGLDADLLDGQEGTYYLDYTNFSNTPTLGTAASSAATDFVAVTGDTMTGGLNIEVSVSNTQLKLKRTTSATGEFNIYTNTDSLFFHNVGQSTYPMMINSSGNVGIGTTNPSKKLHIQTSAKDTLLFLQSTNTTTDGYSQIQMQAGSQSAYIWVGNQNATTWGEGSFNISTTNGVINFYTANSKRAVIDASGNLQLLAYTAGILQTNASGVVSVDTNTYLTTTAASSTYLPLSGGTLTGTLTVDEVSSVKYTPSANYSAAVSGGTDFLSYNPFNSNWHDLMSFQFSRITEESYDGSSWTSDTTTKGLFTGKQDTAYGIITTNTGRRWTLSGTAYNYAKWLTIDFTYTAPSPQISVLIETSADNSTWTTRHTSSDYNSANTRYYYISDFGGHDYIRITIERTSGTSNVNVSSIRLYSGRAGDQGDGMEYELPYNWDVDRNIAVYGKLTAGAGVQYTGGTVAQATTVLYTNNVLYTRGGSAGHFLQNADGSEGMFLGNDHIRFETNSAERLRITSAGDIGIGTSSPNGLFEVFQAGTGRTRGDLLVDSANRYTTVGRLSSTSSDNSSFKVIDRLNRAYFDVNTSTKYISFNPEIGDITMQIASGYGFKVNTSQFVVNATNGNVGIGVTDPEKKLEVKSDITYDGILIDTLSAPEIVLRDRGNSDTLIGTGRHGLDDFHIDTYSGNAFLIKGNTRNVGIGTTSPDSKFHVEDTNPEVRITGTGGTSFPRILWEYPVSATQASRWALTSSASGNTFYLYNYTQSKKVFQVDGTASHITLNHDAAGTTQIGTSTTQTAYQLYVATNVGQTGAIEAAGSVKITSGALGVNIAASATAGRIDASNDIVAYSTSDKRLKENIKPIENALDKVKSLTGVEFDWIEETKHVHGYEGHDVGVIAQEVQEVLPEAIRTNDSGYLSVRYEKMIALLVEANKELATRVELLEQKLKQ